MHASDVCPRARVLRVTCSCSFEHNLEVWRQLWRVVERSDVLCLVCDVRNPLLHLPPALYTHVSSLSPERRLVVVLSKVDLVAPTRLHAWLDVLQRTFPRADFVPFSSKGERSG